MKEEAPITRGFFTHAWEQLSLAEVGRLATREGWCYYAYIIGDDGHVRNRIEVLCDNDDEAKCCAEQLVDGHAIELWQEARRIATFQAKD